MMINVACGDGNAKNLARLFKSATRHQHFMEKFCKRCNQMKSEKEFHRRKQGLQPYCKKCRKTLDQTSYKTRSLNPVKVQAKKEYTQSKREEIRKYLFNYFLTHPCVDCGETDPIVLTFDHQRNKEFTISDQIGAGSLSKIVEEIDKCEVRCANCHMRKTAKDYNWYSFRLQNRV